MNKAKNQWLDDCKEHLVQATGSAYCAGCKELAQSINSILMELDKMEFLGYTGKNARKARKTEGKNMKYALYIESDNGGRAVMLSVDNTWYICDCAPSGCFGDVDILNGTEHEAAARVREAINAGEVYDEIDCANNRESFRYIPEYDGLTAGQIEETERETTLTKI